MVVETLENRPEQGRAASLLVNLMLAPYDELIEVDYIRGMITNLHHVEGKYFVPVFDNTVEDIRRYSAENMVHPDDQELYLRITDPETLEQRMEASQMPGELRDRFRYKLLDGGWRWVEQITIDASRHGLTKGVYYTFIFDVEDQTVQDQVSKTGSASRSGRSTLTGLLREKTFFKQANELFRQHRTDWCMVSIDLENFKLFNEWYGRKQGDLLLATIGAKLGRVEEFTGGLACYLGQDDFCLLGPYEKDRIEQLYNECHQLIIERGTSVGFQPAFGVCMTSEAETVEELYDRASLAARRAKENFHTRIRVFEPSMSRQTERDYRILSDFKQALQDHELFINLQPQCLIADGRVVGAESLVRWKKASGEIISPGVFVPILEKYGFVTDLDKYVWEEVCIWQKRWIDSGHTPLPVSVNVSQIDIFTIDVAEYFEMLVKKYDLPVDTIKIEITESAYVDNGPVAETVARLREKGFLVLMDDFGSGYSSLNMLRSVNVDIIKLDARFLRMDGNDRKGIQILESIINMAKTMGVPIIVEGVETREETDFLSGLGCRYVQGYFFYRPMPVSDFEKLIDDPGHIDTEGFTFKAHEQFHTREFLDENVYSDTMLNNILGPVAFFNLHGEDLDCTRYNQQFADEAGVEDLDKHLNGVQNLVVDEDVPMLYGLIEQAMNDPLAGAAEIIRFRRENGTVAQMRLHFFFLEEDESGKRFYGSIQDITQLDRLNGQMRMLTRLSNEEVIFLRHRGENDFLFQIAVHGLEDALGLSREEFEQELNENLFHKRIAPADVEKVEQIIRGAERKMRDFSPSFPVSVEGGKSVNVQIRFDTIHDKNSGVDYLMIIRKA